MASGGLGDGATTVGSARLLGVVERQAAPRVERDQNCAGVRVDLAGGVAAAERVQQARLRQVDELREVGRQVLRVRVLRQHRRRLHDAPLAAVGENLDVVAGAAGEGRRRPGIRLGVVEFEPDALREGRHGRKYLGPTQRRLCGDDLAGRVDLLHAGKRISLPGWQPRIALRSNDAAAITLEGVGQGTARRLTAEARTPPPPPAASSPWSKELRCGSTTDAPRLTAEASTPPPPASSPPPVLDARPATSTDAIAVEASLEIKPRAPSVVVPEVLLASLAGSTPLLLDMFKSMDRDHDGSISFDEFRTFCHRAGLADEDAAPLFAFFDRRGDGVLTVREMMAGNRLLRAHVAAGQDSFEETLAGYMEYDDGTAAGGGDGGATPRRPSRTTSISPVTVGTDATPERQARDDAPLEAAVVAARAQEEDDAQRRAHRLCRHLDEHFGQGPLRAARRGGRRRRGRRARGAAAPRTRRCVGRASLGLWCGGGGGSSRSGGAARRRRSAWRSAAARRTT